jgi:hypothetical protein
MRLKQKGIEIPKRAKERAEYLRSIHTWESDSLNLSRRHDSFWGCESIMISIKHVETIQEDWISSDHHLIITDWNTDTNLERSIYEEELTSVTVDNIKKRRGPKKKDWEDYGRKVKRKIEENKGLTLRLGF